MNQSNCIPSNCSNPAPRCQFNLVNSPLEWLCPIDVLFTDLIFPSGPHSGLWPDRFYFLLDRTVSFGPDPFSPDSRSVYMDKMLWFLCHAILVMHEHDFICFTKPAKGKLINNPTSTQFWPRPTDFKSKPCHPI